MALVNYEILKELGRGAQGVVYKGLDISNKREVAIKRLRARSRYTRDEISNYSRMKDLKCIPKLYDHFDVIEDGRSYTYLIIELIKGETLEKLWSEYKNWDFIWTTLYKFILVITELHENKYTHGDIHPGNLMWDGENITLIDISHSLEYDSVTKSINEKIAKKEKEFIEYGDTYEEYKEDIKDEGKYLWDNFYKTLCEDYSNIFVDFAYILEKDKDKFSNHNKGHERFLHLENWMEFQLCTGYSGMGEYGLRMLAEYEKLNKLTNEELASYRVVRNSKDYTRPPIY